MNTISRNALINKSIKFRVLKNKETLFVNISSALKDYSFNCHIDKLDEALNIKELQSLCFFTKFYIDGKEVVTNSYFTKMHDNGKVFNGTLKDGRKIECLSSEYDFDYITPTSEELKNLILKNIEDF